MKIFRVTYTLNYFKIVLLIFHMSCLLQGCLTCSDLGKEWSLWSNLNTDIQEFENLLIQLFSTCLIFLLPLIASYCFLRWTSCLYGARTGQDHRWIATIKYQNSLSHFYRIVTVQKRLFSLEIMTHLLDRWNNSWVMKKSSCKK